MSDDLRQIMDDILALHAEEDEIKESRKRFYADAQTAGFNKSALGLAIRTIRARQKRETPEALEKQSTAESYVDQYDSLAHVHVRESYPERVTRPAPIASPTLSPAVQSEAAAGASPEQEASERVAGEGDNAIATQDAPFVMQSSAGEELGGSDDPAPAADVSKIIANPIAARPMSFYRPNCRAPENCASYKLEHCSVCRGAVPLEDDDTSNLPAVLLLETQSLAIGERA